LDIYGVRKYNKNEKEMKVASLLLADSTDSIRVVLWDTNHIALIEQGKIKKEDTIEVTNAYVRGDSNTKELHLTNLSEISLSNIKIENVVNKEKYNFKLIEQLTLNTRAKIRASIVQIFKPFLYDFCLVCNKKVNAACDVHGSESLEKRVILNLLVDDGSGVIRCMMFSHVALKILSAIGINKISEIDENKLQELLGQEVWLTGRVRKNDFQDALELVVDDLEMVEVKNLIETLQNF